MNPQDIRFCADRPAKSCLAETCQGYDNVGVIIPTKWLVIFGVEPLSKPLGDRMWPNTNIENMKMQRALDVAVLEVIALRRNREQEAASLSALYDKSREHALRLSEELEKERDKRLGTEISLSELKLDLARTEAKIQILAPLIARVARLEENLRFCRNRLESMEDSLSWRSTAPLRFLGALIRRPSWGTRTSE